jgi:transglutaminase-like putative cysteine protease
MALLAAIAGIFREKRPICPRFALLARHMHVTARQHDGRAMPILTIRHVTTYRYRNAVAFGEHRMMLRPRDDHDQKVLVSEIAITPDPSGLDWSRDAFGNHVATARFQRRASELRFESRVSVDHAVASFRPEDIADLARIYPFAYPAGDVSELARFIAPLQPSAVTRWAARFLRADGSADTHALLIGMTQTIKETFRHGARHQKGTQDPLQTLQLASGSCRDLAVLMIAALRSLGIAARFVSGYLNTADPDDESITGGNTHAWVQVYVPGPGWVDCDPSTGQVGNENLVRVAVVDEPRAAIPLAGTFVGYASDHLAMNVAVRVAAA